MTVHRVFGYVWAAPNTLLGLVFAGLLLLTGGRARRVAGTLEVHGAAFANAFRWLGAITFGHVVIGRTSAALERSREHEREHVRQYERWGPLFLPAYLAASLWSFTMGTGFYRGNWFERRARAAAARAAGIIPT